jgi:aspartyl-tRNA(Asn)/glutamyl-tRNA(Gln) amidotransferase subunit B
MEFETIICFEVHAELSTRTKLFCNCPIDYDAFPNHQICPVCTGQPGTLPVLNKRAVEYCIRAGLALNCTINPRARFARKNYFYPDLPKGYQISQYEEPLCEDGYLQIPGDDGQPYPVGIKRIHLEEDAGKLVHGSKSFESADYSLVDFNRSGIPLIEIVSDHTRNPVRSLPEARTYLEKMRQILRYIGVSDCIMEKGQFRCDVNISLRSKGARDFGNRTEIKNMSSFKFVLEALEYEIRRQAEILESGGKISQETRLFDEAKKATISMRGKEDAPDYRYFPEPDLVELDIAGDFIDAIQQEMPELPDQRVERFISVYGISQNEASLLTKDREIGEFFEKCVPHCRSCRKLSTWMAKDLFRLLNEKSLPIGECRVSPRDFGRLMDLIDAGEITDAIARVVLEEMFETGEHPEAIIQEKDLQPVQEEAVIQTLIDQVMHDNPETVTKVRQGNPEPINFLIGQVMRKTNGRANPKKVREILEQKLPMAGTKAR